MTCWPRWIACLLLLAAGAADAQRIPEPVVSSDVQMRADRATLVQGQGDPQREKLLLLEGGVSVTIGGYGFRDRQALVRIIRRPGPGPAVRDFAIVFDSPEATGTGGVMADGSGLLVTASSSGRVELLAELGTADALPESPFTRAAGGRIELYDQRSASELLAVPQQAPLTAEQLALRAQRRAAIREQRREIELPKPGEAAPRDVDDELVDRPVLPARGTLRLGTLDRGVYQQGEDEDAVLLLGGVEVMYEDQDEGRDVLLKAQRVVIFVDKGDDAVATGRVDAGRVRGVYLEDDAMVSDGTTTVRAPRAFYDLQTGRAILLDAVVYSVDVRYRVPLYMRASVVRQTSGDSFTARDALFTTSEFARPHLAIGADKITLQRIERGDGQQENWVTAQGVTLRANDTPFFYWPAATTEAGSIPIRRVRVGYEGDNGADIQTVWDLFALSGTQAPEGVELLGRIDLRGEHGLGLGTDLDYDTGASRGGARGYFLPGDSGSDEIASRTPVGFDNEMRGFFHAQHRQTLPAGWELVAEANYVSDPTFLEEFFPNAAYAQDPYETSLYFKKAQDDWALTALIRGETNNFLPQYSQQLTPGYAVNKLPEAEYRLIRSVLDDRATLIHESRIGRMRAVFGDDSPADRGLTDAQSLAAFGITSGTSFDAAAIAAGFPRQLVSRLDSRTELSAPFRAGAVDLTPFAVGRVTAYDNDFAAFNGGNNDQVRLWGGLGVRASTQISRASNTFSSSLFDADGIRHIIEPGVTLAFYDNTMNAGDLPIYDPDVERLTEGGVMRVGVVNTWQTRRGGPGRQRTVDWIRLRTDVVLATEDAANPASLGRYYDYRPEYTLGDDHFYSELMWSVTEATAFTGELTHSFDQGSVTQWRAGMENRHTDRLSTRINYREIDALDARLLSYGVSLKLTTKYRAGLFQVIDFGQGNSRTLNFELDRRIPRASLGLVVGYDEIDGEASIGIVLVPDGTDDDGGLGLIGR